ncbi:MAG: hypothetical protein NTU61_04690, partial [Candidatus Altiarchaeota archaeon]|nr:hypothetical protein [Candidatus Altiarchaeota archaeon]
MCTSDQLAAIDRYNNGCCEGSAYCSYPYCKSAADCSMNYPKCEGCFDKVMTPCNVKLGQCSTSGIADTGRYIERTPCPNGHGGGDCCVNINNNNKCSAALGKCVECLGDGDCVAKYGANKPFCNPNTGYCQQCLTDGDCTALGFPFCYLCGGFLPGECWPVMILNRKCPSWCYLCIDAWGGCVPMMQCGMLGPGGLTIVPPQGTYPNCGCQICTDILDAWGNPTGCTWWVPIICLSPPGSVCVQEKGTCDWTCATDPCASGETLICGPDEDVCGCTHMSCSNWHIDCCPASSTTIPSTTIPTTTVTTSSVTTSSVTTTTATSSTVTTSSVTTSSVTTTTTICECPGMTHINCPGDCSGPGPMTCYSFVKDFAIEDDTCIQEVPPGSGNWVDITAGLTCTSNIISRTCVQNSVTCWD